MKLWVLTLTLLAISARPTGAIATGMQDQPPAACRVSDAVNANPVGTFSDLPAPIPTGPWYINPERTVWARTGGAGTVLRSEGTRNQVLWIRPADAPLIVSGRRTDAAAPPMRNTFTAAVGEYGASELFFPTEGCWKITAETSNSRLTFVVWVATPAPPTPRVGRR